MRHLPPSISVIESSPPRHLDRQLQYLVFKGTTACEWNGEYGYCAPVQLCEEQHADVTEEIQERSSTTAAVAAAPPTDATAAPPRCAPRAAGPLFAWPQFVPESAGGDERCARPPHARHRAPCAPQRALCATARPVRHCAPCAPARGCGPSSLLSLACLPRSARPHLRAPGIIGAVGGRSLARRSPRGVCARGGAFVRVVSPTGRALKQRVSSLARVLARRGVWRGRVARGADVTPM